MPASIDPKLILLAGHAVANAERLRDGRASPVDAAAEGARLMLQLQRINTIAGERQTDLRLATEMLISAVGRWVSASSRADTSANVGWYMIVQPLVAFVREASKQEASAA
jgi:hypothetical protein